MRNLESPFVRSPPSSAHSAPRARESPWVIRTRHGFRPGHSDATDSRRSRRARRSKRRRPSAARPARERGGICGRRRLHHRHDARPDRRGQVGPRRDHSRQLGVGGRRWEHRRTKTRPFVAGIAAARFRNPRIPRRKTRQFGPHRGHCPFPVRSCTPRAVSRSRPPCTQAESSDEAIFVRLEGSIRACGPHHQPPPRTTPPPLRYSVGLSSAGCGRSLSVASPN